MKRLLIVLSAVTLVAACSRAQAARDDRAAAAPRSAADHATAPAGATGAVETPAAASTAAAEYREVTIPAGTIFPVDLETAVGSDTSRLEQPVRGKLRHAVMVHGVEVLPAGAAVNGHVTGVVRPGRVRGRSYVALRFTELNAPAEGPTRISTATVGRFGRTTRKKDAIEVLGPAAAGAVIGRVAGGKSGAAKGAVIGGAGGAGYVLATRGEEVHLAPGTNLAVRLTAPVTVRVPVRK